MKREALITLKLTDLKMELVRLENEPRTSSLPFQIYGIKKQISLLEWVINIEEGKQN
jgi:hypothetical protein